MHSSQFDNLVIRYLPKSNEILTNNGVENKYKISLWKKISNSPTLLNIVRKFHTLYLVCEKINKDKIQNDSTIALIEEDAANAQTFGSAYGYTDELSELIVALKYQKQIENGLDNSPSESGILYRFLEDKLSHVLLNRSGSFLNFGVSYAYIDSILAAKFPEFNFIGIDRSFYTKIHNQHCFGHMQNMEFLAGDIFELLETRKFENGIFFTTRTLCLLPKRFIQKLYKAVANAGFRYIVGVEQIGLSRQTHQPYRFSLEDQPSILFRGPMIIHNYPNLLKEAGFEITETELVKTNHPHPDYRFLSFVATKKKQS